MPTKIVRLPAGSQLEAFRQLRERGSVSSLRGYKREIPVDVHVERCGDAVYLTTPMMRKRADWIHANLAARPEHLSFCNGLALSDNDFRYLIQRKPDDMVVETKDYFDPVSSDQ